EYEAADSEPRTSRQTDRNATLEAATRSERVTQLRQAVFTDLVHQYIPPESVEEQWDIDGLQAVLASEWQLGLPLREKIESASNIDTEEIVEYVVAAADERYNPKVALAGADAF